MSVWLIILIAYALIALGFLIMMGIEAPKHGSKLQPLHGVVALLWPGWAIWYGYILVSDAIARRKRRK